MAPALTAREERGDAVFAGEEGGEGGFVRGGRIIAPVIDEGGGDGGEVVLREDLDRGGLKLGWLTGGEAGEERGAGGLVGCDVEERERFETVGDGCFGVAGGGGGAGEDGGEFSARIGGGDGRARPPEAVAERGGARGDSCRAGRASRSRRGGRPWC